jgi:hypothetical protein
MNFEEALTYLKNGKKVTTPHVKKYAAYFLIKNDLIFYCTSEIMTEAVFSSEYLLAEDWEIVE